jgi:hypothetical protein
MIFILIIMWIAWMTNSGALSLSNAILLALLILFGNAMAEGNR